MKKVLSKISPAYNMLKGDSLGSAFKKGTPIGMALKKKKKKDAPVEKAAQGGMIMPHRNVRDRTRNNTGVGTIKSAEKGKYKKGGQVCRGMGKATSGGRFGRDG